MKRKRSNSKFVVALIVAILGVLLGIYAENIAKFLSKDVLNTPTQSQ